MNMIRSFIFLGVVLGIIGVVIALPLPKDERSFGFTIFMVGFFLAGSGLVLNMFATPETIKTKPIVLSLRITAIGFGVILLASLLSFVIEQENIIDYFYYVGSVVFVIGIILGVFGVYKNK